MIKRGSKLLGLLSFMLVLGGTGNSQPKDVAGWQDARWGMSDNDIVRTFGSKLKKLPKKQVFRGHHVDYIIPQFEMSGHLFTVFFKMDDRADKLDEVMLRFNEMKSQIPRNDVFDPLESLLAHDYGAPGEKLDKSFKTFGNYQLIDVSTVWKFATSSIELDYSWDNHLHISLLAIKYFENK
jgi:hypothetical protein